jgi:hypothetical protein
MPGLVHPVERAPSEDDREIVDPALSPRQATLLSWSWLAGTPPGERSGEWPPTPAASGLPCCEKVCAWRPAS